MDNEIWVLLFSEPSYRDGRYPLHVETLSRYEEVGAGENEWKIICKGSYKKINKELEKKHKEISSGIGSYEYMKYKRSEAVEHVMTLPYVYDYSELPEIMGIYFVLINDEIVYVGKSRNLLGRWTRNHKMREIGYDEIRYIPYKKEYDMSIDEAGYISILKPIHNQIISRVKMKK